MNLSPPASRKLWDILSACEIHCTLTGNSRREYLTRESKKHIGQTHRVLQKLTRLDDQQLDIWMNSFITWMNHKDQTPDPKTPP